VREGRRPRRAACQAKGYAIREKKSQKNARQPLTDAHLCVIL